MKDFEINPSILSADFGHLADEIKKVENDATFLHIDVMDGHYVPNITFGVPVVAAIRPQTNMIFDVHLMIVDPIRYIKEFARIGSDIITFHYEAADDPMAVIDEIHNCGKKAGISIKPGTDVEVLEPFLDKVEMILIMTVEPGFGGQKYIEESTDRIRKAREYITESGRDIRLSVDGGIKLDNVEKVIKAGVDVVVSGSAIFGGDIEKNVKAFKSIFESLE